MEEYLTPAQVARRLRLNHYTVLRWIHNGVLAAEVKQEGKRVRYHIKKAVVDALEGHNPEGLAEA